MSLLNNLTHGKVTDMTRKNEACEGLIMSECFMYTRKQFLVLSNLKVIILTVRQVRA